MIPVTFDSIVTWPGHRRPLHEQKDSPFTASWDSTLSDLQTELGFLRATDSTIEVALGADDFRNDGRPKMHARPAHSGIVARIASKHGPLVYAIDTYRDGWPDRYLNGWQANVRALVLGLRALRAVERYGIGGRGEQYMGWKALGAGIPMPAAMSLEEAAAFLAETANFDDVIFITADEILSNQADRDAAYRAAAKRLHPDVGGDPAMFKRLTDARDLLVGVS